MSEDREWYKDDYGLKAWVFMTLVIGLIIGVLVFTFVAVGWADKVSCEHKANDMGLEWKWSIYSYCMIQMKDGSWVPMDNLRFADIVKE